MRRTLGLTAVAGLLSAAAVVAQQQQTPPAQTPQPFRVAERIEPFAYDVVPNWSLPYPREGYTWGSVPGILVEDDNRILVASRGEIKLPNPLPPGFPGFFGTIRSALNAPENEVRGCLRVLDANGKVVEIWSQWDRLFEGTNGPHKIKISPYDPQHRIWVVAETKNVIYVLSNDGTRLLQTIGEEGVTADDMAHFGKPQDLTFLPDGSVLVADGLTNARIVKLDRSGRFVATWGGKGTEDGKFGTVHGIDVDRNGRAYVADRANKRVQVFDTATGKHLATWPDIRFPNHVHVADPVPGDTSTNGGQVVWVADNMTAEVLKFDTNGKRLFSWHASGPVPGGFGELHQFSLDSHGNVYTADNVLGRPQKLTPKKGADPKQLIGRGATLMPLAR